MVGTKLNFAFEMRADAENTLETLRQMINDRGYVDAIYVYILLRLPEPSGIKYMGWTNLDDAVIKDFDYWYLLTLPETVYIRRLMNE